MAIKGNVGNFVIDILDTELMIFQVPGAADRAVIGAMSLHNTSAVTVVVQLYESTDTTIASGKRVALLTVDADSSADVIECIGQGYSSTNLVAIADLVGVNAKITYTEYTAGS